MATLPRRSGGGERSQRGITLPGGADSVGQVRQTADPGIRVPQGSFGGGDLSIAATGIDSFSDSVRVAAEKQQKTYDFVQTGERGLQLDRVLGEDWRAASTEQDLSDPEVYKKTVESVRAKTDQYVADLPEGVSEDARQRFRIAASEKAVAWEQSYGKAHLDAQSKKADDVLGQRVNVLAAQARQSPAFLDDILKSVDDELGPYRGILNEAQERDRAAAIRTSAISAAVNGRIDRGEFDAARQILRDDRYATDMTPQTRDALAGTIDREFEHRQVLAERQQAQAREATRRQQDDNAFSLWQRLSPEAESPLTVHDIDKAAKLRLIDKSDYNAMRTALEAKGGGRSDPSTTFDLVDRMTRGEDVRDNIRTELNAGRLSAKDAGEMLEKNRTVQRGDDVFSSHDYQQAMGALKGAIITTGPGSQFSRTDEQIKLGAAQRELDDRIRSGNIQLGKTQAIYPIVQDILGRYSEPPSVVGLPRSRFGAITSRADLQNVIGMAVDAFHSQSIDQQTFNQEDALFQQYEASFDRLEKLQRDRDAIRAKSGATGSDRLNKALENNR